MYEGKEHRSRTHNVLETYVVAITCIEGNKDPSNWALSCFQFRCLVLIVRSFLLFRLDPQFYLHTFRVQLLGGAHSIR